MGSTKYNNAARKLRAAFEKEIGVKITDGNLTTLTAFEKWIEMLPKGHPFFKESVLCMPNKQRLSAADLAACYRMHIAEAVFNHPVWERAEDITVH